MNVSIFIELNGIKVALWQDGDVSMVYPDGWMDGIYLKFLLVTFKNWKKYI